MMNFPVITGIIFILSGAIQVLRTEYVAATVWVILGTSLILTQNIDTGTLQLGEFRRVSIKALYVGFALVMAVVLFCYQIVKDYTAKRSPDRGSDRENVQPRQ